MIAGCLVSEYCTREVCNEHGGCEKFPKKVTLQLKTGISLTQVGKWRTGNSILNVTSKTTGAWGLVKEKIIRDTIKNDKADFKTIANGVL